MNNMENNIEQNNVTPNQVENNPTKTKIKYLVPLGIVILAIAIFVLTQCSSIEKDLNQRVANEIEKVCEESDDGLKNGIFTYGNSYCFDKTCYLQYKEDIYYYSFNCKNKEPKDITKTVYEENKKKVYELD